MLRILFEFIANEKRSRVRNCFLVSFDACVVSCYVCPVCAGIHAAWIFVMFYLFGVCSFVCFFLRVDNNEGSSSDTQPIFAMSNDEDNKDDVKIPAVLLFSEEGRILKNAMAALDDTDNRLTVRLATKASGKSGLSALVLYFH